MPWEKNPVISSSLVVASLLGVITGVLVLGLVEIEIKWFVYILLGLVFVISVFVVKDRERFFWALFILSLQIYVSFRIMYGYAGSGGFEFPLAFIVGAMLMMYYLSAGFFSGSGIMIFGGYMATPILLVFITASVSLLFTSEQFVGLVNFWKLLQYYLFYLIGLNCIRTKLQVDRIIKLLFAVLVMQSFVYYVQALMGITFSLAGHVSDNFVAVRAGGTVGANSAIFATFIAPVMMLAIVRLMAIGPENQKRMAGFLLTLCGGVALVLTLRRGAWGGYMLGLIFILYLGYRHKLLASGWLKFCTSFIVILLLLSPVIAEVVDEYRTGNPLDSAFDERMRLNDIAIEVIKNNPVVGVGAGAYSHEYKSYLNDDLSQGWLFTVHNTYLLAAAETGLPGFLALCLFLFYALKLALKLTGCKDKYYQLIGLAMAGYIVSYAFIIYWEPMVAFSPNALLWFLVGMMASIAGPDDRKSPVKAG